MARRATRQAEKPVVRAVPQLTVAKPVKTSSRTGHNTSKSSDKSLVSVTSLGKPDLDGLSSSQQVARLLRDREALVARLTAAEARIADMEAREQHLADRIAWALDTLADLLRVPDAS